MKGPLVAIAIPAFNAARTIGETLDALQRNDGLERVSRVVMLNDCSSDATASVARQHWRARVPFEIWDNPSNIGERLTTNAAISRLAGAVDWTFILHADDIVKPNWLTLYFEAMPQVPPTVASICSSYDVWWCDTGEAVPGEEFPERPSVHVPGERGHVVSTIDKGCWWHLSGCAIRNSAFLAIGGFEPEMPQLGDWEWLLRCLSKGYGVWYVPRSTMLYRQHSKSVSSRSFREARDLKEKFIILRAMREQGYLSEPEHRARSRAVVGQLFRRALARLSRGDPLGFHSHTSLLLDSSVRYVRGTL